MDTDTTPHATVDALVIGGGPAGLQAALTLGRMRRRVLLADSGAYRNGTVHHMHNLVTNDGRAPSDFRAIARAELAAYDTVEVRESAVAEVSGTAGDFSARLADGTTVSARAVVLATGMRDELPAVPGLADLWGTVVAQCPYCHGYELREQPVAILGAAWHVAFQAALLVRIAGSLTILTDGADIDETVAGHLAALGARVRTERVTGVVASDAGAVVSLAGGEPVEATGIFVAATSTQAAPFAEQLGLTLRPSGGIEIDVFGHTSLPGVYAAGDLAHTAALPMAMPAVGIAVAAGLAAGSTLDRDLMFADTGMTPPAL